MSYHEAISKEVEEWPGAAVSFEKGSKHPRAVLSFGDSSRFVVFPDTPGDTDRGILNCLTDVRRELRGLGAERAERQKATGPKRERNPGADQRELPEGERGPVMGDPWEPLRGQSVGKVIHDRMEQGSMEWLQARCGLITASEMKLIINAPPKEETRIKKNGEPYKQREWNVVADDEACRKHIYELAAQRITNFVEPLFQTFDMIRGQNDEAEARARYAEQFGPVQEVGFITNDKWGFTLGYSPDGIPVGTRGAIECKSRRQKYQVQTVVEHALTGAIPSEFIMQHQTGLMVGELDWIDFISFSDKLPMAVIRVYPDHIIQAAIEEAAAAAEAKIAKIIEIYQEQTQ